MKHRHTINELNARFRKDFVMRLFNRIAVCALILSSTPLFAGPSGCEHDKRSVHPPPGTRAHADHTPKHGGVFFMASNGRHHLEGVYLPSRMVKIYLYDEYSDPIQAAFFEGSIELRNEPGTKPIPLRLSDDGTLVAILPPRRFPLVVDAWLSYPGRPDGPKAFSDVFTFEFDGVSVEPDAAALVRHPRE